jgi:hypothetical protein
MMDAIQVAKDVTESTYGLPWLIGGTIGATAAVGKSVPAFPKPLLSLLIAGLLGVGVSHFYGGVPWHETVGISLLAWLSSMGAWSGSKAKHWRKRAVKE